jgi:hypothetical protein
MMRSHCSSGNSSTGETCCTPALFTRMSQPPSSRTQAATISRTSAGFDMSAAE